MSTTEYQRATEKAQRIIESDDHGAIFVCATSIDDDGNTDTEVVSGVDSSTVEKKPGVIRIEQIATIMEYTSQETGLPPAVMAKTIANLIQIGSVDIEMLEKA